jgi:hypothetical protein
MYPHLMHNDGYNAMDDVATWQDLQASIRTLSDGALYGLTHIANAALWPTLRLAMYAYAAYTKEYMLTQEAQFYADFMESIDIKQTITRTRMGDADRQAYQDCIAESGISAQYIVQLFVGSIYTGAVLVDERQLQYTYITHTWDITYHTKRRDWLSGHVYRVFSITGTWPRILVGDQ